jgi:hypothetical protein
MFLTKGMKLDLQLKLMSILKSGRLSSSLKIAYWVREEIYVFVHVQVVLLYLLVGFKQDLQDIFVLRVTRNVHRARICHKYKVKKVTIR